MTEMNQELFRRAIENESIEIIRQYLMPATRTHYIDAVIGDRYEMRRSIHEACENGHVDIVRLLIEKNCDIECEDKYKWRPTHIACQNGHVDIVRLLMERHCDIECEDKDKWRPIHFACQKGHVDIVRLLIEKNCNIECEDKDKWRPIHNACHNGNVDIVQLLIEHNAIVECLTDESKTPLDLAKSNKQNLCVQFLQKYKQTNAIIEQLVKRKKTEELVTKINCLNEIKDKMNLSVLETVVNRNMEKIIDLMMDGKMDDKCLSAVINVLNLTKSEKKRLFLKERILIRCVKDQYFEGFSRFCSSDVVNSSHGINNSSLLEVAASTGYGLIIDKLLKKTVYNKDIWRRAQEIAQQSGYKKIVEDIADREFILSSRLKRNFSVLHTAVCDNDADMLEYLLREKIVDANINHDIFGTALALAHSLCHRRCIAVLERFNVDTNTQNKFGQSPLHEAVASGTHEQCRYLMERCEDIDKEGFNKLTALQCSVIEGCADLCEQLMQYGANCTQYTSVSIDRVRQGDKMKQILPLTNKENCLTLCLKLNRSIYSCFLPILNQETSNCCDGSNNSLLHLAVNCLRPDLCKLLLDKAALIIARNNQGNTCLLELLLNISETIEDEIIEQIINIVNLLVKHGDDVNAVSRTGRSVFQLAYTYNNEKLMMALLSQSPNVTNLNEDFNLAIENKWFEYLGMLIKLIPKSLVASVITEQIIIKILPNSPSSLIKCLFGNAHEAVQQSIVTDILLIAVARDDQDLFEYLLNKKVEQPKLLEYRENLLTFLLRHKKGKYIKKLMRSPYIQFYCNVKNKDGQFPLQVALELDEMKIVDHLLVETNDVNNKDRNGETALMQLLKKLSICNNENIERKLMRILKIIIQKGGDINMKMGGEKEIIDLCSRPDLRNEIITLSKTVVKNVQEIKVVEKVVVEKSVVEKKICCVCLDREIECVFQCGHNFCVAYSDELSRCPLCNKEITTCTKLYFN